MQVLEVMKTHVVKTTPDAPISEAVDLMDLYQVGELPVVDEQGILCGMIAEADVLGSVIAGPAEGGGSITWNACVGATPVSERMSSPAVAVAESADLQEAAELLLQRGLKRLPVTRADGRVVGTLNRIDILQAIFEGNLG